MELGCAALLGHEYVHKLESFLNPIFKGFLWKIHYPGWLVKLQQLVINSITSPSPLPGGCGVELKVLSF